MSRRVLYALASALLLSLPWWGAPSWSLFIAFVPLLLLQQELSSKVGPKGKPSRIWPYALLAFALWWISSTWWVGYAAVVGVVAATLTGATLNMSAFMLYHAIWRRAPRALAYTVFVAAWIGYEFCFLRSEISFPWLNLGNGFSNDIKWAQWFEYTGSLGGTLWVLVVNLFIFEAWKTRRRWRCWITPAAALALPAILSVAIYYSYGNMDGSASKRVKVTIVQPNIDPYAEKFQLEPQLQTEIILGQMCKAPRDVDFIIGPETALQDDPYEHELDQSSSVEQIRQLLRSRYPQASAVCGTGLYKIYPSEHEATRTARSSGSVWYDYFNSAVVIDTTQHVGIHYKTILVVGVEMIPYYHWVKRMKFLVVDLGGIAGQMGQGREQTVFTSAQEVRYGTAICYEAVYGDLLANFVCNGAQVLFVISNDGWWGDTPGHRQLFGYSRLRAIETRRSVVRSANTGISGFITPRGEVIQKLDWGVREAITREVPLSDRQTFYVRYGDWVGRLSLYVLGLSLLYFMVYRIRKRTHFEK